MSSHLVLAPSFPALLDLLLEKLRQCCLHDPLAPKWVVVPTATAANHLRLKLGQEVQDSVLAGVRIIPLPYFLRRLGEVTEPTGTNGGQAPGGQSLLASHQRWGPTLDLLLFELVEQLPVSSPLSRLQHMPSGYRLLRPTFLDLADGGFGLDQLDILEELAEEPDLAPLEQETLQLYAAWIRVLDQQKHCWEPLSHQGIPEWILQADEPTLMASLACENGQTPQLLVYGFYGFTDVNAQVIAALGKRIDLTLFYPFRMTGKETHPAFSFGQPVLEDLKVRLGTALTSPPDSWGVDGEEGFHKSTRFFLSTFPEGKVPEQPPFLTFQYASGIRAEVLSAALRVRQWMEDTENPIPAQEIMVVAPDSAPYLDSMREVFAAFAIPLRTVDVPVGLSPENRPLRMLARIWEDQAPAEWVLAYLRDYPEVPAVRDIKVDEFEWKVRKIGVWGDSSWQAILLPEPDPPDRHFPRFTSQEETLVREILDLWGRGSRTEERTFTPKRAAHFLNKLRERWLQEPTLLDPLVEALQFMDRYRPELLIRESMLREMLLQVVDDSIRSDPLDHSGVLFVPSMRARSLTAKAIVLLGLASGAWPRRIEEDPLFSDASRRRLMSKARDVGHLLPVKSQVSEEMSMLFFLLNTSAEQVHWVIPESDDSGRSVAPTPWVQRYIQRWGGAEADTGWSRISRGPAQQGEDLLKLDPQGGSFLPPDLLVLIHPDKTSALSGEIPYDYLFQAQELRRRGADWNGHIPAASRPVSGKEKERIGVTDLEVLAKCPYHFYAHCSMRWEPLIALQFADAMNPLDWGNLVHKFLEQVMEPWLSEKTPLQEIAKAMLRSEAKALRQAARKLSSQLSQRLEVLPPVFRQAELNKLEETVKSYLEKVVKQDLEGDVPMDLEFKKRVPFPGLEGLLISGKMDRIDQRMEQLRIYDYKSGKAPEKRDLKREVFLGYRVQPILYPWIFREQNPKAEAEFSYIFLGESPPHEMEVPDRPAAEEFLRPLAEILEKGMYLPTPTETLKLNGIEGADSCRYCEFISLCRRFDPGAQRRYAGFSEKHISSRLEAMKS
ncbi:MAG: PD-(D/E)XK nuclease family protein [Acidobacteria bacterium]|nr:PD-(D/E)XK nuclease family protein [Acidobacteriota bacterium]